MKVLALRVIDMADKEQNNRTSARPTEWSGLAEIDRAIAEDRITAYRWRKAWADPWNRTIMLTTLIGIGAVFAYLAGAGLHFW